MFCLIMGRDKDHASIDPDQAQAELAAMETRLKRYLVIAVAAAAGGSLLAAPWRVTAGLTLGGALAYFNYHWLHTALSAVMGQAAQPDAPQTGHPSRFVLRHFVIGFIVAAATLLNLVSLPATIIGLLALPAVILFEGLSQIYFSTAKEEI
jgi:hypothetical protein